MRTTALIVIVSMCAAVFCPAAYCQSGEEPAVETSSVTAADAGGTRGLSTAIEGLNYKLELLSNRYAGLTREIDELKLTDRNLHRAINDQTLAQPDSRRLDNLETESALIRSEIAQVREDMSLLRNEVRMNVPDEKKEDVLHSPWIAIGALGLSLLALIVR